MNISEAKLRVIRNSFRSIFWLLHSHFFRVKLNHLYIDAQVLPPAPTYFHRQFFSPGSSATDGSRIYKSSIPRRRISGPVDFNCSPTESRGDGIVSTRKKCNARRLGVPRSLFCALFHYFVHCSSTS